MPRQRKYVLIALVLQLVQVVAGQFSTLFASLAGLSGMGIPLVVGWLYSVGQGLSPKKAATGGMLIGLVGALAGLILAAALGAVEWSFIPLGTVASTVTGMVGALLGALLKRSGERPQAGS